MEYYKVYADANKFMASVQEYNDLYKVRFGGSRACLHISVYKNDDKEFPNLDSLTSKPDCNIQGNLPNKEGTVLLVKTCFKFLLWKFPFIKHIQFIDLSTKECFKQVSIDLSTFHFAKYGLTWYQHRFDAKPLDNKYIVVKSTNKKPAFGGLDDTEYNIDIFNSKITL